MAQLTIDLTIPDNKITEVRDAFVAYHGWTATIPDPGNPEQTIQNPVTKNQCVKQVVGKFVKDSVRAHQSEQAANTARQLSIQSTDSIAIT